MTEHTKLINEARLMGSGEEWIERDGRVVEPSQMVTELADALEAALAVIERIKATGDWLDAEEAKAGSWWSPPARKEHLRARYLNKIDAVIAASPSRALGTVKADAWDEGYTTGNRHNGRRDANPYRTEAQ